MLRHALPLAAIYQKYSIRVPCLGVWPTNRNIFTKSESIYCDVTHIPCLSVPVSLFLEVGKPQVPEESIVSVITLPPLITICTSSATIITAMDATCSSSSTFQEPAVSVSFQSKFLQHVFSRK